jgi:hypothetical protein
MSVGPRLGPSGLDRRAFGRDYLGMSFVADFVMVRLHVPSRNCLTGAVVRLCASMPFGTFVGYRPNQGAAGPGGRRGGSLAGVAGN